MSVKLPYMDTSAIQRGIDSIGNALQQQHQALVEQQTASAGLALKKKYNDMVNQFTQEQDFSGPDWGQKGRDQMGSAIDEVAATITDERTRQAWQTSMASQMEDHTQSFRAMQVQKQGEQLQLDVAVKTKQAKELAATDPKAALDLASATFQPKYDAQGNATGFSQAAVMKYGSPVKAFEAFTALHDEMAGAALQTQVNSVLGNDQLSSAQKVAALEAIKATSPSQLEANGFHLSPDQKTAVATGLDPKINDLKGKIGDENYASVSLGISAFSAGLDPKTGGSSQRIVFQDTTDGKPAVFGSAMDALKALRDGKVAVSQSDQQKVALSNQLESLAKWQKVTGQGLMNDNLKGQLDAKVQAIKNKWLPMTPAEKNQDWLANKAEYSDVFGQIGGMINDPSILDPVVKSSYDYGKEKLKSDPKMVAVLDQFMTDINARLRAGADPKAMNAAIVELVDKTATQGTASVLSRALGIKGAADTTALAQDDKWVGGALSLAAKGELPTSTMLHDNLNATFKQGLGAMVGFMKSQLSDIGDITQTSQGFEFTVTTREVGRPSVNTKYRFNGDDTGKKWLDRLDGKDWTTTNIDLAKSYNPYDDPALAKAKAEKDLKTQAAVRAKGAAVAAKQAMVEDPMLASSVKATIKKG